MAAKEKVKEVDLVELLEKANAGTLATIDEKIAAKTAEREALTKKLDGELAALTVLRKAVSAMVHGKPERKKRQAKAAAVEEEEADDEDVSGLSDEELRTRMFDFIAEQDRACKPGEIGAAVGIHHLKAKSLLKHEWFRQEVNGYVIA